MEVLPHHKAELIYFSEGAEFLAEFAARTCTRTEDRTTGDPDFIERMIEKGHGSVLEHNMATFRLHTDRAVANELVRHRLAGYSQQSTRYVRYDGLTVVKPVQLPEGTQAYFEWQRACASCEISYMNMLACGHAPQVARSVLPNCTATRMVMTANLRMWRHILNLRVAKNAHPDCRILMVQVLWLLHAHFPSFFNDLAPRIDEYALDGYPPLC